MKKILMTTILALMTFTSFCKEYTFFGSTETTVHEAVTIEEVNKDYKIVFSKQRQRMELFIKDFSKFDRLDRPTLLQECLIFFKDTDFNPNDYIVTKGE